MDKRKETVTLYPTVLPALGGKLFGVARTLPA